MLRLAVFSALLLAACSTTSAPDGGRDAALPDFGTHEHDGGVDLGPPAPATMATAPVRHYVNPFLGSGGIGYFIGNSYPGPQRPFGMVKPSPDTSADDGAAPGFYHCSGYYYRDTKITGFSHTRMQGTGVVEYGVPAVMPTVGMDTTKTSVSGYASSFSHDREQASPGYYAVTLDTSGVRVELTSTDRVALHRWTYPAGSDAVALFDLAHAIGSPATGLGGPDITISDASVAVNVTTREVHGFVHYVGGYSGRFGGLPVYFVARFDHAIARHGVWKAGVLAEGEDSRTGADAGAYVAFDTSAGAVVQAAFAISFVDEAHARLNLDAEAPTIDFDATRTAAETAWETALARVEIAGRSDADFTRFYTALYHTLLMPTLAMDVDGAYRGMDTMVHTATGFRYYTDFSLWDTFRSFHPLMSLLYPEYQRDFARSLVRMGEDGGYIDRWPLGDGYTEGMVGESATIVFADSWAKGVRDFDLRSAYATMRLTAMGPTPPGAPYGGRGNLDDYLTLGFISTEGGGGSVSKTQEYAYDDWALARMAEALGTPADLADRDMFDARARNYAHLYDPASGFMEGRHRDGTFEPMLTPSVWNDVYVEGDAWQYLFYAPHDLGGLAALMGGRGPMLARLEGLFEYSESARPSPGPDPYYWHGNEPDLHYAWMFSALGEPAGTARWSRWIVAHKYASEPGENGDGLPGNDDAGTMSAWLVFAMSGFYTIAGTDTYLIGSPTLTHVTMHLPAGDLVVDAPDASESAPYVQAATLDGESLDVPHFAQSDVAAGGLTLHLEMGATPSRWGTSTP